jgi:putative aminopeptidase FrvX
MSGQYEDVKRLLKLFIEASGPSGYEDPVRKLISNEVEPFADEMQTDTIGNLIFVKKGSNPKAPALLIMAHMDEIGMMVKYIDAQGFIRFSYMGGFFDQITLGQRVVVRTAKGNLPGVIGSKPPHLMKADERKKVVTRDDMFIDIGASSREDAEELGVQIGDPITWVGPYTELSNNLICGKALDNRALVPIMVQVFKNASSAGPLIGVASVREETGLQGARTSTFSLDLDYPLALGISLDIALAGDFPLVKEAESPIFLGRGPTITIAHGRRVSLGDGYIIHPGVKEFLLKLAKKNNIPYQLEIMEGGITDATVISLTRRGIPTANVGLPTRYVHSPGAVASLEDINNTIKLLTLVAKNVPPKFKRP